MTERRRYRHIFSPNCCNAIYAYREKSPGIVGRNLPQGHPSQNDAAAGWVQGVSHDLTRAPRGRPVCPEGAPASSPQRTYSPHLNRQKTCKGAPSLSVYAVAFAPHMMDVQLNGRTVISASGLPVIPQLSCSVSTIVVPKVMLPNGYRDITS